VPPRVEFLWWEQCPSWERALADLRKAMSAQGLDPESIVLRRVATEDDAKREAFVGSPTIRVNGADVHPPEPVERVGLLCRLYRRRDGRFSPLPDPKAVRETLAAAVRSG